MAYPPPAFGPGSEMLGMAPPAFGDQFSSVEAGYNTGPYTQSFNDYNTTLPPLPPLPPAKKSLNQLQVNGRIEEVSFIQTQSAQSLREIGMSDAEIYRLLAMGYKGKNQPIVDDNTPETLGEIVSIIFQFLEASGNNAVLALDNAIEYFTSKATSDEMIFDQPSLLEARLRALREPIIITAERDVVRGLSVCEICKSNDVSMSAPYQASSGDEASLVIYTCMNSNCGHEWGGK